MPPLIETGWARLGLPFALTLLAYATAGSLALLIAIPPGYASPLYPAAGIALASVLIYGRRMLGAVALGAFCVNAVPVAARGSHDLAAFALPAGIALAAALQTGAVAALVRRLVRQPLTLTLPADVARFMAACLTGSLVSATLATAMLGAAGIVPEGALALNWGTWWIGDLTGMLIATPIALTLIGRPRSEWAPRRIPVGVTLALVTAFLALAIVQMERWNGERARASFSHDASNASLILMTQLQEPLRALEALRGVFSLSRQPSRAEMRAATENWLGSGAIRAMGWSERVRREDIGAFEARARADGNPGYRVFDRPDSAIASAATAIDRPATENRQENGDVIAIRQIEPLDSNVTALGVNAMSVPSARAAILAAVETGRPAATAGFRLTQQSANDRQIGVVVYQAIYDHEVTTPADRRVALRGVVFVSLAMDAQLAALAGKIPDYLDLCVIDGDHLATRRGWPAAPAATPRRPAWCTSGRYAFAGRQWELRVTARPQDVPDALDRSASLFAAAGLLSAAMLGASLLITTGRTRRIEIAVRERTADLRAEVGERHVAEAALRESEQRFRNILDNVPIGVIYSDLDGRVIQANPRFCELTGYSEAELAALPPTELTHPDDAANDAALTAQLVRGEIPMHRRQKRFVTRAGEVVWVRATVTLLRDSDDQPWRIVGVVEDITEHLRLEEAERAREARRGVQPGEERVPVAHEPRAAHAAQRDARLRPAARARPAPPAGRGAAPLGRADPAGRLAPAGHDQRHARPVAHRVRHAAPAAGDARPAGAGGGDGRPGRQRRRCARGITISAATSAEAPRACVGDATRVKQILTNLLSATPSSTTATAAACTSRSRRGAGPTRRDRGHRHRPGHDAGAAGASCSSRSTASAASASATEGTGIGLVISQRLAELMGGSLRRAELARRGLVVHPARCRAPSDPDGRAPTLDAGDAEPADYHQRLVHYVEDNETNVEVMRGILAQRPQVAAGGVDHRPRRPGGDPGAAGRT